MALGSTLATILLTDNVALSEGIAAFMVLIGLQYAVTWLSVRSSRVSHLVKSEPALLYYHDTVLHDQLRRARVTESELCAEVRQQGIASLADVQAIVLETDGSFAIVKPSGTKPTAPAHVSGTTQA